MVNVFLADV